MDDLMRCDCCEVSRRSSEYLLERLAVGSGIVARGSRKLSVLCLGFVGRRDIGISISSSINVSLSLSETVSTVVERGSSAVLGLEVISVRYGLPSEFGRRPGGYMREPSGVMRARSDEGALVRVGRAGGPVNAY